MELSKSFPDDGNSDCMIVFLYSQVQFLALLLLVFWSGRASIEHLRWCLVAWHVFLYAMILTCFYY